MVNGQLLGVIPWANANHRARSRRVHRILNLAECCIRTLHLVVVHNKVLLVPTDRGNGQKQKADQ